MVAAHSPAPSRVHPLLCTAVPDQLALSLQERRPHRTCPFEFNKHMPGVRRCHAMLCSPGSLSSLQHRMLSVYSTVQLHGWPMASSGATGGMLHAGDTMCLRRGLLLALVWQAVAVSAQTFESTAEKALSLYSTGIFDTKDLAANFNNGTLYSGNNLTEVRRALICAIQLLAQGICVHQVLRC